MITEGTLWMRDIEPWMDEAFIIEAFKECGFEPKSVKLIIDKRLNKYYNNNNINIQNNFNNRRAN